MSFLSKKSITKYILYGIGEIILVVIGILIAVSINNRNQKKASENRLKSYLEVYQRDLAIDTTVVSSVLKYIDAREAYFNLFLSDTVEANDYIQKPQGYGITLSYAPFKLQQKGISLLENYVNDSEIEQDSLITIILANHKAFDNLIQSSNTMIGDDISDHLTYLKENEPWIADLLMGKLTNPDMLPYFLSDGYRARLAVHHSFIYRNLKPQLTQLQKIQHEVIEALDSRVASD